MTSEPLDLTGIDGATPLGFLAALGTLVTIRQAGEAHARLRWKRGRTWIPVLDGVSRRDLDKLSEAVAGTLRGRPVSGDDEAMRAAAQREFDTAKKAVEDKKKELRARGLSRKDRELALEQEVRPLEQARDEKRQRSLSARRKAVPSPELALGKRIDCTTDEYRQYAADFLVGAEHRSRETLDLLAAFGSDACRKESSNEIAPTPFCFISGSAHQYFLDTVRQLMGNVTPEGVRKTLFEAWAYRDAKLSMRWDPTEDRRYALMDHNPSDEPSKTVWMANLLAYRALPLFTCAPARWGLATTSWTIVDKEMAFTWPIWEFAATPDMVRSLLQLEALAESEIDGAALRARGIAAAFRSRRLRVGAGANYKLNFTLARGV